MRVAVAGSGNLSQYISQEFPSAGHETVFLTRTYKSYLEYPRCVQAITDYSQESLDTILGDCDVLISTIVDFSDNFVATHKRLITAAQRSPTCKRFIPSEFAGDVRSYPDQPAYFIKTHFPIRQILKDQTDLEWTVVCVGLFADYVVPAINRYLMDMREGNMIDFVNKRFTIPGTGHEAIDMTSARDVARSLANLINMPAWEPFTYMSGSRTTWSSVIDSIQRQFGSFSVRKKSLRQIIDSIASAQSEEDILFDTLLEFTISGSAALPQEEVQRHKQKYFNNTKFRSYEELLNLVLHEPGVIV